MKVLKNNKNWRWLILHCVHEILSHFLTAQSLGWSWYSLNVWCEFLRASGIRHWSNQEIFIMDFLPSLGFLRLAGQTWAGMDASCHPCQPQPLFFFSFHSGGLFAEPKPIIMIYLHDLFCISVILKSRLFVYHPVIYSFLLI